MSAPTVIREVAVRYRGPRRKVSHAIRQPAEASRIVRSVIGGDAREHFVALLLDGRHRAIAYQVISIGTATASLVHPREVCQAAVSIGAVALFVAHNHPSGDPSPSREDLQVTERLTKAGELLGIRLLDSVVVTESGYVSIREEDPERFTAPQAAA